MADLSNPLNHCSIDDNSLDTMLEQAQQIEEGISTIKMKIAKSEDIGCGQNALECLNILNNQLKTISNQRDALIASLKLAIHRRRETNFETRQYLMDVNSELNKIEENPQEVGHMPMYRPYRETDDQEDRFIVYP